MGAKGTGQGESFFKELFENAPIPYQSLDSEGKILIVNRTWLDFLGYDESEVIGSWFVDFLGEGEVSKFEKCFPGFKEEGQGEIEFVLKKKCGTQVTVFFKGKILYDNEGEFVSSHCVFADFSEYKKREEEIEEENKTLAKFQKLTMDRELKMVEMKERIKELEELLGKVD